MSSGVHGDLLVQTVRVMGRESHQTKPDLNRALFDVEVLFARTNFNEGIYDNSVS